MEAATTPSEKPIDGFWQRRRLQQSELGSRADYNSTGCFILVMMAVEEFRIQ